MGFVDYVVSRSEWLTELAFSGTRDKAVLQLLCCNAVAGVCCAVVR